MEPTVSFTFLALLLLLAAAMVRSMLQAKKRSRA